MQDDYSFSKGSLGSDEHAKVRFEDFYSDILHLIPHEGILIDAGGGAGRDAVAMQERSNGGAMVFSIDPDPARYADSQKIYPGKISLANDWDEAQRINAGHQVIFVQDDLQCMDDFNRISNNARGNFVLCNAVMMFIPEEDHQKALNNLRRITLPEGVAVIRYRTENLTADMVRIDHDKFESQCNTAGFYAERTAPLDDALGRSHKWHQLILSNPWN